MVLALWLALVPRVPAAAATPTISLPSPSASGQQITVSGTGFCPDPGCSGVSVTVDQRVAAAGVSVAAGGTFSVAVRITELPGQYSVLASQQTPGGQLSALHGLVVVAGERQAVPPPGAVTPPAVVPPAPGSTSGAPPPGMTTDGQPGSPGTGASPAPIAAATSPVGPGGPLPWWAWAAAAAIAAAAVALAAYIARRRR